MKYYEIEEIPCPHCNVIDPDYWETYPITYWGEDGAKEVICSSCDKFFFVDENVRRSYMVTKERE